MSLLAHRAAVLKSVSGSTAAQDHPDLVAWIDLHLNASAGRAEAAVERSRERSERLRRAIRKAAAALPMDLPVSQLVAVVHRRLRGNAAAYGLSCAPSLNTIRDEIRLIQTEQIGTETT